MYVLLFHVCFRYVLFIVHTAFCALVFVGLSGPLLEMGKGMCLEPAMLYRPPLASPRRGWMELPDVGDICQVVIQKWMNHILTEIPLHPLYV